MKKHLAIFGMLSFWSAVITATILVAARLADHQFPLTRWWDILGFGLIIPVMLYTAYGWGKKDFLKGMVSIAISLCSAPAYFIFMDYPPITKTTLAYLNTTMEQQLTGIFLIMVLLPIGITLVATLYRCVKCRGEMGGVFGSEDPLSDPPAWGILTLLSLALSFSLWLSVAYGFYNVILFRDALLGLTLSLIFIPAILIGTIGTMLCVILVPLAALIVRVLLIAVVRLHQAAFAEKSENKK